MCKRGINCCQSLSVRPSVYPSVYCTQTAEDIVTLFVRPGSHIILVILTPSADTQFQGEPLQQVYKYTKVGKKLRFCD